MRARLRVGNDSFEAHFRKSAQGETVEVDGESFAFQRVGDDMVVDGTPFHIALGEGHALVDGEPVAYAIEEVMGLDVGDGAATSQSARVRPPMTGKLDAIHVQAGQIVTKGQVLFVLEAMKMQNEVRSPVGGVVTAIHVKVGNAVEPTQVILDIGPATA